jgi:hypothetical protein
LGVAADTGSERGGRNYMNLEEMKRELAASGKTSQLKKMASSPEAERLAKTIDKNALKSAAARGDEKALGQMLQKVLSTEDGQALLKKVSRNFDK